MNTEITLSKYEIRALVNKSRRNSFGMSEKVIASLIEKGLVDAKTKRLTDDGIAHVEIERRRS